MKSTPLYLATSLARLLVTLWVGGMWAAGYIVAPVLFKTLAPDNILAGNIAGQIFAVIAWIGLVTASYLLVFIFATKGRAALREKRFWCVAVMLVCVAVGYFGIQWEMAALKAGVGSMDVMESAARGKFALLHGLSEAIYLVQSLLGAWLAITLNKNL